MPLRTSRNMDKEQQPVGAADPRRVKLDVLAALRREVDTASGNRALAKMVADFGAVTNKSSGRTVTKDGFAFLEGLAARLKDYLMTTIGHWGTLLVMDAYSACGNQSAI
jgi:casein kinase 1